MWARFINIAVGIWVMAAPTVLQVDSNGASNNNHITGPIIVTFATIAINEATRPCRWIVFVAGLWLVFAPFVIGHWSSEPMGAGSDIASGCVCMVFALVRGKIEGKYAGGWSMLWRDSKAEVER